jgi:hypothetical protein
MFVMPRWRFGAAMSVLVLTGLAITGWLALAAPAAGQNPSMSPPQTIPTGHQRVFAPGNSNLDIDGLDDNRIDVDVAVLDTGVDLDHPDLNLHARTNCTAATGPSYQCTNASPSDGDDSNGHGTGSALDIAAIDNGIGRVGMVPGARIWAVDIAGPEYNAAAPPLTFDLESVIAGVNWVADHSNEIEVAHIAVICVPDDERAALPTGPPVPPRCAQPEGVDLVDDLENALAAAMAQGVVFSFSAGNWYSSGTFIPQRFDDMLLSSSMFDSDGLPGSLGPDGGCDNSLDDHTSQRSSWGPHIDIASPGCPGSQASSPLTAAAAMLASKSKPTNLAGVQALETQIENAGNTNWTHTSPDTTTERLLDVSNEEVFDPRSRRATTVRHVFYRSNDGQLREWWFSDTGEWNPVAHGGTGEMAGDPAAVVTDDGRRFVYYRGTNGQLNQYWFDNNGNSGHSGWGYANHMAGDPVAVIGKDGRRHVFYRSNDGQLREWWFSDTGEWNPVAHGGTGEMGGDPAAVVTDDGRRFVYYRGTNGQLNQYWFDNNGNSGHSGWGYANWMEGTPAAAVSEDGQRRWVFYEAGNGQLTRWWFRDSGEWDPTQWGYAGHVDGSPAVVTRLAGH